MMRLSLGLSLSGARPSGPSDPIFAMFGPSDQGLLIDPSDISSIFQDNAGATPGAIDSAVGKINDKSGKSNHLTQATAAAKPILRQTSGKNYLDADGLDDFLGSTAAALRLTGDLTIVAAIQRDTTGYAEIASCQTNAGSINQYEFRTSNQASAPLQFISGGAAIETESTTAAALITNTTPLVVSVRRTAGVDVELTVGAVAETFAHTVTPTSNSSSAFRLFSRTGTPIFMDGRCYWLMIISRRVSDSELAAAKSVATSKI